MNHEEINKNNENKTYNSKSILCQGRKAGPKCTKSTAAVWSAATVSYRLLPFPPLFRRKYILNYIYNKQSATKTHKS